MSTSEFGQMVERAMQKKSISRNKLGYLIGVLPDGRTFDATGIRHMLQGKRRYYDSDLVARLVEILDLDPTAAYPLAGVWPPDLHADEYREVRQSRHHSVKRGSGIRPVQAADTPATQRGTTSMYTCSLAGQRHRIQRPRPLAAFPRLLPRAA